MSSALANKNPQNLLFSKMESKIFSEFVAPLQTNNIQFSISNPVLEGKIKTLGVAKTYFYYFLTSEATQTYFIIISKSFTTPDKKYYN